ncbi:MAG: protein-L-isoaspartate(D-aspartate) O-methyltransferase [Bacteroidales bacterium]|nr:protein-L-isoaspartate(D-aspartate) O-methyltransferase [Bacteroidales bacterium]
MTTVRPADTYRHQGLRKLLVQKIKQKGITDQQVLAAMEAVPRHYFFDSSFLEYAYEDKPFPIGAGQTISQPYTVAFQTELLSIRKNEKVLEIGTGSGYQACILAEMGAKVFTIERQKTLFDRTSKFLSVVGYPTIKTFFGDGYKGLKAFAPFDKMIVTAAAPYIPDALLEQLKPGGILVIPVGANDVQTMTTITKNSDGTFEKKEFGAFRFVPMLEDKAKET